MNEKIKQTGRSRQNVRAEINGSHGTEVRKVDSFSNMAYLGKSTERVVPVSGGKSAKSLRDGRKAKTVVTGSKTKRQTAVRAVKMQSVKSAVRAEGVVAAKKGTGKLRPRLSEEERRLLREELIKETNSYLDGAAEKRKTRAKKSASVPVQAENERPVKRVRAKGEKPVKILFLGGVGEIGKNMTAIEYGNDIIVIDAGLSFPDEEMPGVDLVVPDVTYLVNNKDKIKGILITHGHEDHIGGLPYLLKQINSDTPIYATKLTLALADNKIKEHRIQNVVMCTKKPGDKFKLGCFDIELVNVNHSISGAVAFAIGTPRGLIYHSGDFKIDITPVAGKAIDLARISDLGKSGVTLYLGESTNIERPGYTMSETVVGTTFEHLFAENSSRRIIIATFASNVHRLKQIIDVAVRYRRKVALSGRSMLNVVEAASKIGELTIPEGVLIDVEKAKNYFDNEIVIISTGTQGEPMSALTRMANGEFNKVSIGSNDTIIISASPIPGNEKMIYRVINNLYKKGANVVYESLEKVHVSGHACQEEHKIVHSLLNPKFFIPIHGEYRHLKRHALLAEELGTPEGNIIIPEVGNCVELTENSIKLGNNIPAGVTVIDGGGSEDLSTSEALKDRKLISAEGMFVVSLAVSDGVVVGEPQIYNRGVMLGDERDYKSEMNGLVRNIADNFNLSDRGVKALSAEIEKGLREYLYRKTKQSPLILPVINEV